METSQNKRADLPASKASRPIAPLKPNEMQHSKEFPATQLRTVSNKSPFIRTGFQPKQARQSPDLQYSMVAWRGFLSALRATRPLRLKPSGEFLKTAHRAVFLTEFHLIGSNPHNLTKKPKQARQSPDLQHSMVAWRGFEPPISALRGRRPKPLDDQAMRASIKQLE